jgi:hypothetical protein
MHDHREDATISTAPLRATATAWGIATAAAVLVVAACRGTAPAPFPIGQCAPDREKTEIFAFRMRQLYGRPAGADTAAWAQPDQIVAVYDDSLCARAVQAWRAEDRPADSLQRGAATARLVDMGGKYWMAQIVQAPCSYHVLNRDWHHAKFELEACM